MNLLIIGTDVDELAMKVWQANTNYTVLNMSPPLWGKDFKKFYKSHKKLIITSTAGQFLARGVDEFVDLMCEYQLTPIFIAKDKDAIERVMHTNVEETLPYSVIYIGDEHSEKYPELITLLQEYITGKGFITNGNNTISTPREREGTSTTE
jgi:hypothetical protein